MGIGFSILLFAAIFFGSIALVLCGVVAVVIGWIALTWPHFRPAFRWDSFVALLVLAVLANLCYCAAYIADLSMQYSSFRDMWRRWRWALWFGGTLFAILFANYWIADEIYSFVPNIR